MSGHSENHASFHQPLQTSLMRRRVVFGMSLLALFVVGGGFVWKVFSRPICTPLLTLTGDYSGNAADGSLYPGVWELNRWVAEDLSRIKSLHGRAYHVSTLAHPNELAEGLWDDADARLRLALRQCPVDQPLMIYVNLHGAVNDQGKACVVPPQASPTDASTWLPLKTLIDHVARVQPQSARCVVLLMESGKLRNWDVAGISDQDFEASLADLVQDHHHQHPDWSLTVVSSTSEGQRSIAVNDRVSDAGNLFTRFVVQGLDGAADGWSASRLRDGWVDVHELHRYVRSNTARAALRIRASKQTPTLFLSNPDTAAVLGYASRSPRDISQLVSAGHSESSSVDQQLVADVAEAMQLLQQRHPARVAPIAWSNLQRRFQGLVSAATGGQATQTNVQIWQRQLHAQVADLSRSLDTIAFKESTSLDRQLSQQAANAWRNLAESPTHATAQRLCGNAEASSEVSGDALPTTTAATVSANKLASSPTTSPLLFALASQGELRWWSHPQWVKRLATAQATWLEASRDYPLALSEFLVVHEERIAAQRRQLADVILCDGMAPGGLQSIDAGTDASLSMMEDHLEQFELSVAGSIKTLESLVFAMDAFYQSSLELPEMCQWMGAIRLIQLGAEESQAGPLFAIVQQAAANLETAMETQRQLGGMLQKSLAEPQSVDQATSETVVELSRRLSDLTNHIDANRRALMEDDTAAPAARAGLIAATLAHQKGNWQTAKMFDACKRLREIERSELAAGSLAGPEESQLAMSPLPASLVKQTSRLYLDYLTSGQETAIDSDRVRASRLRQVLAKRRKDNVSLQSATDRMHLLAAAGLMICDPGNAAESADTMAWLMDHRRDRMLAFAGQTIDDFWREPAIDGEPYFSAAGKRLIQAAIEGLHSESHLQARTKELQSLIASRLQAARGGVQASAECTPGLAPGADSLLVLDATFQPSLPQGLASVCISERFQLDPSGGKVVSGLNVQAGQPQRTNISLHPELLATDDLRMQIFFRGHAMEVPLRIHDFSQARAVARREPVTNTQLTVLRSQARRRAVSFILDCSASMAEPAEPEATRPATSTATMGREQGLLVSSRLDAARAALMTMLDRLQNRHTQVGVGFYGHRVATNQQGDDVLIQKQYFEQFPFTTTLQPYEDVELVLPVGRFGDAERSLVEQRLRSMIPWGQTPLYLAIQLAIADLQRLEPGTAKDLIVISDGQNYQFNPSPDAVVTVQQLIDSARRTGVRLHLIGFALEDDALGSTAKTFQSLAHATGGEAVTEVSRSTELLAHLDRLTQSSPNMVVEAASGNSIPLRLSQRLDLTEVDSVNSVVTLKVNEQPYPLVLSPGMHLVLQLNEETGLVRSLPYQDGAASFVGMRNSAGHDVPAKIGLHHVPPLNPNSRTIRLSLQREDDVPSDRPVMMWAEVTPQLAPENEKPDWPIYQTGNFNWENQIPCPVASFTCEHWPLSSSAFQVQVWCAATTIKPMAVIESAPGMKQTFKFTEPPRTSDRQLKSSRSQVPWTPSQVSLYRTDRQLRVVIEHGASQADRDQRCIVQMPETAYDQVSHWYSPDGKSSVHDFEMVDASQTLPVEFYWLGDFKASAVSTIQPLRDQGGSASHVIATSTPPAMKSVLR